MTANAPCAEPYFVHVPGRLSRGAALDVGLKCVHACRFCYYSYLDKSEDQFRGMRHAKFRTLAECKEILRRLKANGFVNFDITGGEPTLHPDIIEIVRYAHQELALAGRVITLGQYLMRRMKNGRRERLVEDLLEAGLVNVLFSMHAVDEALFHRLTGESWERQRRAMEWLDERGFQYTTNTTVVEWNHRHLPAIAREVLRHGVYLHNFIVMNAYYEWNRDGRAFGVQARYADIHPYLAEAVEILESADVAVNIRYAPLCAVRGMEKNLVGMVAVRYDPYEWMNVAGHFGGSPELCAARLPVAEGGIDPHLEYRPVRAVHPNGVRITGMRGEHVKHFAEPCARCAARPACDGIDPNYLRQYGASEFVPYDAPQPGPLHAARYAYLMPFIVKSDARADMKAVVREAFAAWRKVTARAAGAQSAPELAARACPGAAPRVSVVVTCYNYGRYLREAVGSVLAQTWRDYELIVVDDGSTDDTPQVLADIVARNPQAPMRVLRQANSGQPAHARNRGIAEARGAYVLCLDADDLIAPTMLERCVAALEGDPGATIAYTDRLDFGAVTQLVRAAPWNPARLPRQNHVSYCALYRRRLWEEVGGYRANVKGCEDWDFWVAACARGHRGVYLPEPLFLYRRHEGGLWEQALAHFDERRAQIVLNNPSLYRPEEIAWARARLTEAAGADGAPLVSVIVATRNRPRLLADALASLVAQDYRRWEAIVVNDGGEDVEAVVRAADPAGRVRYVAHPRRLGSGAARNTALALARGEVVCYLDDDDLWQREHLATVVQALTAADAPSFVYTDAALVDEELREDERCVLARSDPWRHEQFSFERLLVSNYIPINSWAHRWDCAREVGGFDATLEVLEDWDFLLRVCRRHAPRRIAATTVQVRRRPGATSRSSEGRPKLVATWERLYAATDDLCDETVRAARRATLAALRAAADPAAGTDYARWLERHSPEEIDAVLWGERMVLRWRARPVFHLVCVVPRALHARLADTLDSLAAQLYANWRLTVVSDAPPPAELSEVAVVRWRERSSLAAEFACAELLAGAEGDWVGWLPAGVRLAPHALLRLADHIDARPHWKYVYTDSDHVDATGRRCAPRFRPDCNLDLLRSTPYMGEVCFVARDALAAAGDALAPEAAAYDLALRVLDACGEDAIGHVADVLWHAPLECAEARDSRAARRALEAHLARRGIAAQVSAGLLAGTFRVRYRWAERPLVSVLVCAKDRLELLRPAIESVLGKTAYAARELLVVDAGCEDPDALAWLDSLGREGRARVLRPAQPLSPAAAVNAAARAAQGEYLLLLAPDTEVVQPEWLERMLEHAQRPEVGIVGARLVYPETGVLRHAGIVLGLGGAAGRVGDGAGDLHAAGPLGRFQVDQNYAAVSGACLLVRRSLFASLGGLDSERFPDLYADVDLCLRAAEAGFKVVWTPYATLVQHGAEEATDGSPQALAQAAERLERAHSALYGKWLARIAHDPAYNRHLSLLYTDMRVETAIVVNWEREFHDRPRVLGVSVGGGCGEYRVNAPLRALSRAGLAQTDLVQPERFHQARLLSVSEVARAAPARLLYHAALAEGQLESMARIRRELGLPIVFGLDDLVTDVPRTNSSYRYAFRDARRRLRRALALCDRAVVTTEPLAALCRELGAAQVHVVPNRIERALWDGLRPARRRGPRPRIGWAGAQQHAGDLALLAEVVAATADEADWVFFGMCPEPLRRYAREVHPFEAGFVDYVRRLASLGLDLAVAPLEVNAFNEAKSNLRLLEYGMLGWPVVCSDILPYRGAPVARVPNEPAAWIAAIRERLNDLEAARREGERLRQWVLAHHVLEDRIGQWAEALGLAAQAPQAAPAPQVELSA